MSWAEKEAVWTAVPAGLWQTRISASSNKICGFIMYSFLLFSFVPLSYHIGIRLAKEIRFYGYFCDTNRSNGGREQKNE